MNIAPFIDHPHPERIDIKAVAAEALHRLAGLLRDWLPGGRQIGPEYVVRNPLRADARPGSFKINLRTGRWSDFATGDEGGDAVSLFAYLNGVSQVDAARQLADQVGAAGPFHSNGHAARPADLWRPIIPVPEDAPTLKDQFVRKLAPSNFFLSTGHWYCDPSGARFGAVARYSRRRDGKLLKSFKPFMYCEAPDGRREWRCKGFPAPRPLYGVEILAKRLTAPVLVIEGEKTADAAHKMFDGYIALTSLNGAHSVHKTDWSALSGRHVTIWPDHDDAGSRYAADVVEQLQKVSAASVKLVKLPSGLPDGWDIADALPPGMVHEDLFRLLTEAEPVGAVGPIPHHAASWPEPKPLPSGLLPVMNFDPDMIPGALGPWVADIADRMQAPPDFVAIPAVVALAATVGRKIGVRPQMKTDWIEVCNFWGCIVGRPGAMKSPAMAEAMKPLNRLEAEARESNKEQLKKYNLDVMEHKLRQDEGQKAARVAIKGGATDISDLIGADEPEKPAARRFIIGDCTYEALGEVLVSNPNGILAFRDELVSLLKTLDREEYVNARGFFLTGWNGTSGYPFDRIGRGSTFIESVCISLMGSTQPGRLSEYLSRVIQDSAGNDGLLQRFALLVWPDDNGAWREVDRYPDTQARTTAWDTFTRLNLLTADQAGAVRGEYDAIPTLRFNEAARGRFGEWRQDLESRLRAGSMHSALESHLAKYRKLVPTLALLNHLADVGQGPICETAVLRAIAFAEYLESHAKRAYGSGTQLEAATAKSILSRIRKGHLADTFTARDIQRHDWSNLADKDQIAAGLDLLDDLDWIKGTKATTGGRPKTIYTINPRALK